MANERVNICDFCGKPMPGPYREGARVFHMECGKVKYKKEEEEKFIHELMFGKEDDC